MEAAVELCSPLSLENICRVNLLFRLEKYPVQQLLLLPTPIRRGLSLGLSPVDVLHYEAAGLFHDFETASVVESARQEILDVTLGTHDQFSLFIPSILPGLVPERQVEELSSVFNHISQSFSSFSFKAFTVYESGVDYGLMVSSSALIPDRLRFLCSIDSDSRGFHDPTVDSLKLLLEYCHFLTAPKEVKIDVIDFLSTPFWKEFKRSLRGKRDVVLDPVMPLLQSFLSNVETLEIHVGTTRLFKDSRFEFDDGGIEIIPMEPNFCDEKAATYLIFYNIITSSAACLKYVRIFALRREVIEFIVSIAEQFFTDGSHITMATRGYWRNDFPCTPWLPLQLATAPPSPYRLQSLSITHSDDNVLEDYDEPDEEGSLDRRYAENISSMVQPIVLFQLKSLEHVSIDLGSDYCYDNMRDLKQTPDSAERNYMIPEYRQLLSALTDLLKQPQLQSLCVGRAPLTEAYQMIEVFLCTETTHTLSLTIEGVEEESKWVTAEHNESVDDDLDSDDMNSDDSYHLWKKVESDKDVKSRHAATVPSSARPFPSPPAHPLLVSNGTLKSLDIGCSCDGLHAWLFTIPNLQLKTSRPDLALSSGVPFPVI